VKIEAYVNKFEGLKLKFTANAVIEGFDVYGPLSGEQISSVINKNPNTNLTIIEVTENSVKAELSGTFTGSFGWNENFIVSNAGIIDDEFELN
jgi:hypothetical protein